MLASKAKWNFHQVEGNTWVGDSEFSPIIQKLFMQRGIYTDQEAKSFLEIDLNNLHQPEGLSMIEKAVQRVHQAIENKEQILVFGDYDADGVTSTALLMKALQELGADCDFYIPNRFTEGYGPNKEAFQLAYNRGISLILTVDTGIAAIEEALFAKELGLDLIITDHHELQEELPKAYAIINPKCSPDYPFHELAGVGVTFKFAQALLGYFPEHLLEFVAIGTIADLVPLVDENRILAYYGLRKLSETKNAGIKALLKLCQINGVVTEEDVGFQLGPRINAVGRLQDAELAVELFLSEDNEDAEHLASEVHALNEERKKIVVQIVKEAEEIVAEKQLPNVIVVAKEGWNEGVLGIVASRLVQKYQRPAIVLAINPEKMIAKGSARSIPAFNMFKNCMEIKDLFEQFGGHSQAAGMTIPYENIEEVQSLLSEAAEQQLIPEDFKPVLEINQKLEINKLDLSLIEEINQLAPFGIGNPKPLFVVDAIPNDVRQLGANQNHLKLKFTEDGTTMEAIGFQKGALFSYITKETSIEVAGELSVNEWNGNRKVQMIMTDLRIKDWQLFDHRGKKEIDITSYLIEEASHLVVCDESRSTDAFQQRNVTVINYDTDMSELTQHEHVYFLDLPLELKHVEQIIQQIQPQNIHVCYYVEDSVYLKPFPTRDTFIKYYSLVKKQQSLNVKQQLKPLMSTYGWSKDLIIFMSEVFIDLKFLTANNGVLYAVPNPDKKDLQDSTVLQERKTKIEIEKILYYSTYEMLKQWFGRLLVDTTKDGEETNNGLQTTY